MLIILDVEVIFQLLLLSFVIHLFKQAKANRKIQNALVLGRKCKE